LYSKEPDKSLTVSQDGQKAQEWLDLANGCMCCSAKDQSVNAIESLMERRGAFDYILLETTGLADPGNVAPLFWVDEGLGSSIYLDGIVTLVDAKNISKSLDEKPVSPDFGHGEHGSPELTIAHLQISHADVVVVNKSDLVTADELDAVTERIQGINGLARLQVTNHSQVPQLEGLVLDLHAYDNVDAETLNFANKGHSHLDPVRITRPDVCYWSLTDAVYINGYSYHSSNHIASSRTTRCVAAVCSLGECAARSHVRNAYRTGDTQD